MIVWINIIIIINLTSGGRKATFEVALDEGVGTRKPDFQLIRFLLNGSQSLFGFIKSFENVLTVLESPARLPACRATADGSPTPTPTSAPGLDQLLGDHPRKTSDSLGSLSVDSMAKFSSLDWTNFVDKLLGQFLFQRIAG